MLLGKKIGPYLVEKELGSGAMGAVFRGKHTGTGDRVAIKIIAPGLTANESAMRRFQREIDILKQLEHPNIARIYRSGKLQNTPFYVMEYIEGQSLDLVLGRRDRLPWEEVVNIGRQLCAALQYAHERGIIHRDLKPSNLMFLKDGTVKLTDFGIAKDTDVTSLTADNSTVGTAAYMSPEQCKGLRDLTLKSDVYSMGIMFYELLTGRKPFHAETIIEMFKQHTKGTFTRPSRLVMDIPIWLDTLVCQCLEKEPEKRPLNAAMVADSLALVQEKWELQVSAGVEAANKRKIDKVSVEGTLDEEDKDIARALVGKKKKKKKAVPFYRKGWFSILALLVVLGGVAYAGYYVFFRPPDADALYRRLAAQVEAKEYPDRQRARPWIDEFLDYHPTDSRAAKVAQFRDQLAVEEIDYTTHNRRYAKFRAENKEEETAWAALDAEDGGKLKQAAEIWNELLRHKGSDDLTKRAWALLSEKYLGELNAVENLYKELKDETAKTADTKKLLESAGKDKALALEAVLAESAGEKARALLTWGDLKSKTESDLEARRWYLLAAWRYREVASAVK